MDDNDILESFPFFGIVLQSIKKNPKSYWYWYQNKHFGILTTLTMDALTKTGYSFPVKAVILIKAVFLRVFIDTLSNLVHLKHAEVLRSHNCQRRIKNLLLHYFLQWNSHNFCLLSMPECPYMWSMQVSIFAFKAQISCTFATKTSSKLG